MKKDIIIFIIYISCLILFLLIAIIGALVNCDAVAWIFVILFSVMLLAGLIIVIYIKIKDSKRVQMEREAEDKRKIEEWKKKVQQERKEEEKARQEREEKQREEEIERRKQEYTQRQQEEEERKRQEYLLRKQEEDRIKQESLKSKQEAERKWQERKQEEAKRRQEEEERKRQAYLERQQEEEKMQQIKAEKRKELLESSKEEGFYSAYETPVFNYIEKVTEISPDYFYLANGLFYPRIGGETTIWFLERDGMPHNRADTFYSITEMPAVKEITSVLINGINSSLKDMSIDKSIFENRMPFVYLIIRNNVIKYFHNKYLNTIGYENVDEFCENIKNTDSNAKALYFYYYIYKNDILQPIMDTYKKVLEDILQGYDKLRRKKLEESIFGKKEQETATAKPANKKITIEQIDSMSGRDFEIFIYRLFTQKGYKCELTPASGDYGIDVIIKDALGTKIGIQTKCYKEKVSNAAVQEVYAGLKHYNCDKAMIITNSYFTPAAIQAAKENNVTLWDRNELIKNL